MEVEFYIFSWQIVYAGSKQRVALCFPLDDRNRLSLRLSYNRTVAFFLSRRRQRSSSISTIFQQLKKDIREIQLFLIAPHPIKQFQSKFLCEEKRFVAFIKKIN